MSSQVLPAQTFSQTGLSWELGSEREGIGARASRRAGLALPPSQLLFTKDLTPKDGQQVMATWVLGSAASPICCVIVDKLFPKSAFFPRDSAASGLGH